MKKLAHNLVKRYGAALCTLAAVIAPVAVNVCRFKFYQPKEPAGLEEFASKNK